jgi:hypothetical protein
LEFTVENIENFFRALFESRADIYQAAIVEVFDELTKYDEKNRLGEGWKTNSSYKINEKIIVPHFLNKVEKWSTGYYINSNYYAKEKLDDFDRALCFISGYSFESIGTITHAWENFKNIHKEPFGIEFESSFFYCKVFMKGTLHLKFKEKFHWAEFNRRAAQGKGWLAEESHSGAGCF